MPTTLDYARVLDSLPPRGLVCVYPGSGAFDLADPSGAQVRGWIAYADSSIRPAALEHARLVPEPVIPTLVARAGRVCEDVQSPIWLTPKSHWAYELEFGSSAWLPDALRRIGIDPEPLRDRHGGDAILFEPHEFAPLAAILRELLNHLAGSDFLLTFPDRKTVCTVHHHQQLWWRTAHAEVWAAIESAAEPAA